MLVLAVDSRGFAVVALEARHSTKVYSLTTLNPSPAFHFMSPKSLGDCSRSIIPESPGKKSLEVMRWSYRATKEDIKDSDRSGQGEFES